MFFASVQVLLVCFIEHVRASVVKFKTRGVMQTKVSSNGQVVLPDSIRRKLGIQAGDSLDADVQNGNVVLSPISKVKKPRKARIVTSPVTGLPVLDAREDAPILTNEMVREMLADFP